MMPDDPYPAPFGERGTRILKIAVITMALMLVFGFLAIIFIIAYRAVQLGDAADVPAAEVREHAFSVLDVEVDANTLISQIELDGERMAVHVTADTADEIIIIDIRTGELLGRVKLIERDSEPAE
jgi:hypothetical protein